MRRQTQKWDPKYLHQRLRWDRDEFKQVEEAANRRGLSVQEFTRLATKNAADRVMALPPDEVLGRVGIVTNSNRPRKRRRDAAPQIK
jgi:hypothetical protein